MTAGALDAGGTTDQDGTLAVTLRQTSPGTYEGDTSAAFSLQFRRPGVTCDTVEKTNIPARVSLTVFPDNDSSYPSRVGVMVVGDYSATAKCCDATTCWQEDASSTLAVHSGCTPSDYPVWTNASRLDNQGQYTCGDAAQATIVSKVSWNLEAK
ncbi:MAG: hypothetical protein HOO96_24345 [Polyangiaceae bacterium]|nr:hypothetical protein [Polyangiaceae bacterium]